MMPSLMGCPAAESQLVRKVRWVWMPAKEGVPAERPSTLTDAPEQMCPDHEPDPYDAEIDPPLHEPV